MAAAPCCCEMYSQRRALFDGSQKRKLSGRMNLLLEEEEEGKDEGERLLHVGTAAQAGRLAE